ncbi:hypothetical protein AB0C59_10670 [Streptomyces sp. NPDC048664]
MKAKGAPVGLVMSGVFVMIGCGIGGWYPGLAIGAALILGALLANRGS